MPKGKDLGLNRSPVRNTCRIEQSSERMIANIAFANYRSCRASSTGSTRTEFLVGTSGSRGSRERKRGPTVAWTHTGNVVLTKPPNDDLIRAAHFDDAFVTLIRDQHMVVPVPLR